MLVAQPISSPQPIEILSINKRFLPCLAAENFAQRAAEIVAGAIARDFRQAGTESLPSRAHTLAREIFVRVVLPFLARRHYSLSTEEHATCPPQRSFLTLLGRVN